MGLILAIDPGPTTCGLVLYDAAAAVVLESRADLTVAEAVMWMKVAELRRPRPIVAIERVQAAGISGASLLQTSEVVGRLHQAALMAGYDVRLVYRREVCRVLDVSGGGKDAQVRQRMLEAHPRGVGTKKAPGPLYGVSSHAWQALGLAYAVANGARDARGEVADG